ncbi:hypothetical protein CONCODRAFT_11601 [Conidiobolus coronatus NRRL 28638]|uniref:Uncharacterized protein n=1 Tax=Conidiobolus coronatus (strain ATCC 28846 / CBS 209.66 / NRRL 28638) TaxID=796925 RepID=A0A137NUX5_CONC2|nr:hypothetical protein CONCODRAFT_11601 [Conidiobolus coronatus NRRL 28638]|eukprot:KXN66532.1 hypothetical protein CONCODRAFT_11601 [Conidiobolus coronatus NRRL 28638]
MSLYNKQQRNSDLLELPPAYGEVGTSSQSPTYLNSRNEASNSSASSERDVNESGSRSADRERHPASFLFRIPIIGIFAQIAVGLERRVRGHHRHHGNYERHRYHGNHWGNHDHSHYHHHHSGHHYGHHHGFDINPFDNHHHHHRFDINPFDSHHHYHHDHHHDHHHDFDMNIFDNHYHHNHHHYDSI